MKKAIYFLFVVLLTTASYGQNKITLKVGGNTYDTAYLYTRLNSKADTGSYFKTGGNYFGSNASIGSKTNYALDFLTSNIVRGRLHANGNWTLGSTVDNGARLRVNGLFSIGGAYGSLWYVDSASMFKEIIKPASGTKPVLTWLGNRPQWREDSVGSVGSSIDTTSLSSRINQKQNYTDTTTYDATQHWVTQGFVKLQIANTQTGGYKISGDGTARSLVTTGGYPGINIRESSDTAGARLWFSNNIGLGFFIAYNGSSFSGSTPPSAGVVSTTGSGGLQFSASHTTGGRILFRTKHIDSVRMYIGNNGFVGIGDSVRSNLGERLRVRGSVKVDSAFSVGTLAASDADYTIGATTFVSVGTITANRVLTLPDATLYPGRLLTVWNRNSTAFTWTFSPTIKDAADADITALANDTVYQLISNGTIWIKTN
jgi:hypothetical protein